MFDAKKILIVDDNPGDRTLVLEALHDAGSRWQPVVAASLTEAQAVLAETGIALILVDLHLPEASGVDTVVALSEFSRGIPIIALTGMDEPELGIACVEAGAQDFVSKTDLDGAALERMVQYAISRHDILEARERQRVAFVLRAIRARFEARAEAGRGDGTDVDALAERIWPLFRRYFEVRPAELRVVRDEMAAFVDGLVADGTSADALLAAAANAYESHLRDGPFAEVRGAFAQSLFLLELTAQLADGWRRHRG